MGFLTVLGIHREHHDDGVDDLPVIQQPVLTNVSHHLYPIPFFPHACLTKLDPHALSEHQPVFVGQHDMLIDAAFPELHSHHIQHRDQAMI